MHDELAPVRHPSRWLPPAGAALLDSSSCMRMCGHLQWTLLARRSGRAHWWRLPGAQGAGQSNHTRTPTKIPRSKRWETLRAGKKRGSPGKCEVGQIRLLYG
jgi:hypothetical protein